MGAAKRPILLAQTLLVLVTLVWGSTFPLVKSALLDVSPLFFNFLRMALAAAVLAAINAGSLRKLTTRDLRVTALAGFFLGLGYELQTVGLTRTTPTKSAFITGLVVVLVPLLSAIPRVRPPSAPKPGALSFAGAFLAFAGLILLTTPPGSGAALLSGLHFGEWLTLGCAFSYSAHLLTLARIAEGMDARRLGTLQIAFAALLMLLLLPFGGHPTFHFNSTVVAALLITSLLATAAAFTIQSWAQQFLPASHTALIFTMEPVFAWLTSLLFLGERLGPRALTGAGCILGGIVLAELGPTLLRSAGILPFAQE